MKKYLIAGLAGLFVSSLICINMVFGEGSLEPPLDAFGTNGAPRVTMKTLDQIEPRRLISSLPYTITNSGSYYVTGDLLGVSDYNGIVIDASNVQLDLNGFALKGSTNTLMGGNTTLTGIYIDNNPPHNNITIRNGVVYKWGQCGIKSTLAFDVTIEKIMVSYNGGTNGYAGMSLGTGHGWTVIDCKASGNNGDGINVGPRCSIRRTVARGNHKNGFSVMNESVLENCSALFNSMDGIRAGSESQVRDCIVFSNQSNGVNVTHGAVVVNNQCSLNGNAYTGAGILAGDECRIDGNYLRKNQYGIQISPDYHRSIVIRNIAIMNTVSNYDLSIGTCYSEIITNEESGFTNPNPWANFSFF